MNALKTLAVVVLAVYLWCVVAALFLLAAIPMAMLVGSALDLAGVAVPLAPRVFACAVAAGLAGLVLSWHGRGGDDDGPAPPAAPTAPRGGAGRARPAAQRRVDVRSVLATADRVDTECAEVAVQSGFGVDTTMNDALWGAAATAAEHAAGGTDGTGLASACVGGVPVVVLVAVQSGTGGRTDLSRRATMAFRALTHGAPSLPVRPN